MSVLGFLEMQTAWRRGNSVRSADNYLRGYGTGQHAGYCVRWRGGVRGSGRLGTRAGRRGGADSAAVLPHRVEAARRAVLAGAVIAVGPQERVDDRRVCRGAGAGAEVAAAAVESLAVGRRCAAGGQSG